MLTGRGAGTGVESYRERERETRLRAVRRAGSKGYKGVEGSAGDGLA